MGGNTTDLGRIKLLVLDVDGVMTDGRIILTPSGEEIKEFHVRDGSGIKYWQRAGKAVAMITGRASPAVKIRAEELGVGFCRLGVKQKLPVFEEACEVAGVTAAEVAVIGDDLPDLPIMQKCGYAVAVVDAVPEVLDAADYVTTAPGGRGAVREAIEHILRSSGQWEGLLARYLSAGDTTS